jgi:Domain of unknown function (DUF1708)
LIDNADFKTPIDSNMARDSFATFIPLSVDSDARTKIIFDFFDLMAAIAAHGKSNGLGGRKLSRYAGWWAFEHSDNGIGFEGGYKSWARSADATSHLFFAYLRSLAPDSVKGLNGISTIPISLQTILQGTEYPPETPIMMQSITAKVIMIVNSVSPTPFALLRRAKHFEYRDDDRALQEFANYEDPVEALTEECRRVLKCISSTNQSSISTSKNSTSLRDASWSRFEDIGFSGFMDESDQDDDTHAGGLQRNRKGDGLRAAPHSGTGDLGRPQTPSWADFLSDGFVDEPGQSTPLPLHMPNASVLPPIDTSRVRSSQSNRRQIESDVDLAPGELASINKLDLDDAFWWVWITSLAGEESNARKAVFGRCALVETKIRGSRWLIIEEKVIGAKPAPEEGAYIVEKKSRFWTSKRNKTQRRRSVNKAPDALSKDNASLNNSSMMSNSSTVRIGGDQHARIQAAAALLQKKQAQENHQANSARRGRHDDAVSQKTSSVFTLQPVIMNEAAPAMKWANKFDKEAIREAYLAKSPNPMLKTGNEKTPAASKNGSYLDLTPTAEKPRASSRSPSAIDRDLPAIPPQKETNGHQEVYPKPMERAPTQPNGATEIAVQNVMGAPAPVESVKRPATPPAPEQQIQEPSHTVQDEPENLEELANKMATQSQGSTPEKAEKLSKLQKPRDKNQRGFRKLFAKKKAENSEKMGPPPSHQNGGGNLQVPQNGSGFGRRFSMRKNKGAATPEPGFRSETPASITTSAASYRSTTPTPTATVRPDDYSTHGADLSRVNTNDEQEAHRAFSSFDQGPLDDMPAFAPEGHSPDAEDITPGDEFHTPMPMAKEVDPTPTIPAAAAPAPPAAPAALEKAETEPVVNDRWAQIRKNAAERAAKQSEEQSRPSESASKEEDGETSGEESKSNPLCHISVDCTNCCY